jgi:hypothetical protein
MSSRWFVRSSSKTYGPFSSVDLKRLAVSGKIKPETQIATSTDGPWLAAGHVRGLFTAADATMRVSNDNAPTRESHPLNDGISSIAKKPGALLPSKVGPANDGLRRRVLIRAIIGLAAFSIAGLYILVSEFAFSGRRAPDQVRDHAAKMAGPVNSWKAYLDCVFVQHFADADNLTDPLTVRTYGADETLHLFRVLKDDVVETASLQSPLQGTIKGEYFVHDEDRDRYSIQMTFVPSANDNPSTKDGKQAENCDFQGCAVPRTWWFSGGAYALVERDGKPIAIPEEKPLMELHFSKEDSNPFPALQPFAVSAWLKDPKFNMHPSQKLSQDVAESLFVRWIAAQQLRSLLSPHHLEGMLEDAVEAAERADGFLKSGLGTTEEVAAERRLAAGRVLAALFKASAAGLAAPRESLSYCDTLNRCLMNLNGHYVNRLRRMHASAAEEVVQNSSRDAAFWTFHRECRLNSSTWSKTTHLRISRCGARCAEWAFEQIGVKEGVCDFSLIETLEPDGARVLVDRINSRKGGVGRLWLNGLTHLDGDVAQHLAKCHLQSIECRGVKSLAMDAAKHLAASSAEIWFSPKLKPATEVKAFLAEQRNVLGME